MMTPVSVRCLVVLALVLLAGCERVSRAVDAWRGRRPLEAWRRDRFEAFESDAALARYLDGASFVAMNRSGATATTPPTELPSRGQPPGSSVNMKGWRAQVGGFSYASRRDRAQRMVARDGFVFVLYDDRSETTWLHVRSFVGGGYWACMFGQTLVTEEALHETESALYALLERTDEDGAIDLVNIPRTLFSPQPAAVPEASYHRLAGSSTIHAYVGDYLMVHDHPPQDWQSKSTSIETSFVHLTDAVPVAIKLGHTASATSGDRGGSAVSLHEASAAALPPC